MCTREACFIFERIKLILQDMQDYRGIIYVNENIRKTIPFSIGLDELKSHRFDPHEKCPACMMGKSHLNNKQGRKERSNKPLAEVYVDISVPDLRHLPVP